MHSPEISVIVPVYNAEAYLHRCVDSILTQTYTNFEILLINDGSTDRSGAICDEYATLDSRVNVFHKTNGGVSSARNQGLDNAKGKWITFVDADDWIESNFLKILYDSIKGVELVCCDFVLENTLIHYDKDHLQYRDYDTISLINLFNNNPASIILTAPWGKLFYREIIESKLLRFDKNILGGEDTIFTYTYLFSVKNMRCVDNTTYHYWITGLGLSSKADNEDSVYRFADSIFNIATYLEQTYGVKRNKFIYNMSGCYMRPFLYKNASGMSLSKFKSHINKIRQNKCFRILMKEYMKNANGKREKIFRFLYGHKYISLLKLWISLMNRMNLSPM